MNEPKLSSLQDIGVFFYSQIVCKFYCNFLEWIERNVVGDVENFSGKFFAFFYLTGYRLNEQIGHETWSSHLSLKIGSINHLKGIANNEHEFLLILWSTVLWYLWEVSLIKNCYNCEMDGCMSWNYLCWNGKTEKCMALWRINFHVDWITCIHQGALFISVDLQASLISKGALW